MCIRDRDGLLVHRHIVYHVDCVTAGFSAPQRGPEVFIYTSSYFSDCFPQCHGGSMAATCYELDLSMPRERLMENRPENIGFALTTPSKVSGLGVVRRCYESRRQPLPGTYGHGKAVRLLPCGLGRSALKQDEAEITGTACKALASCPDTY